VLTVPHVYAEDVIADELDINLRQKTGSELPFVKFINGASSTDVIINASGIGVGKYLLMLESYD
jgi:hypothetical protein